MFKIGEFSKLTQVSVRMLRHYDEVGLLKPAKVDEWTGYRMYSVEQIALVNKIIYLRDSGFQVAEMASILQMNEEAFLECLTKKHLQIEQAIQAEQEKLRKIQLIKEELLGNKSEFHYQISIKAVPSYQVLSFRKVVPSYYSEGEMWKEVSVFARERGIQIVNSAFSLYHDEDYREENVDIELCVPVKEKGQDEGCFCFRDTEAVPYMASTMVSGDFSGLGKAYRALADWLSKHEQYQLLVPTRQIVHRGPCDEENPERYLTEIQIPLKRMEML